jgi:alkyl hydroperoxide reductase subunit D
LSTAIAARNPALTRVIEVWAQPQLDEAHVNAARAAAAIMGMNNIYYRFLHLVEDGEYQTMPARLRMNVIGNPGIDKLDFELLSLAVSAVNGCGLCVTAHERKLRESGVSRETIQSAVRIASVIHAVAGVLEYQAAA